MSGILKTEPEKVYFLLIALLVITLPWPILFANIATGILVFYFIISGNYKSKWLKFKTCFIPFLLCSYYYFLSLYGMLFTENVRSGLFLLEVRLGLLLIPFVIFSMPFLSEDKLRKLFTYFLYSCYVSMVYCLVRAFFKFYKLNSLGFINYNIFTVDLLSAVNISHVYYGMYLAFALLILSERYVSKSQSIKGGVLYYLQVLSVLIFLILITAKMAIISVVIIVPLLFIFKLSRIKAVKSFVIFLIFFLGIVITAVKYNPNISERFNSFLGLSSDTIINDRLSYTSTRIGPMKCSLALITDYGWTGLGTGDVQVAMNAWYMTHLLPELLNYESHSLYLNTVLSFGIIGILILVFVIIRHFILAKSIHYTLYLLFIGLITLSGVSENILDINKGVLFYALFISLFTSNSIKIKYSNGSEY